MQFSDGHRPPLQVFLLTKRRPTCENASMNSQRTGLRIASLIFALVTAFHVVRLVKHTMVVVGSHNIPMGLSWAGAVVGAVLCIWMWRLSTAAA
jgi:hypothetical protein